MPGVTFSTSSKRGSRARRGVFAGQGSDLLNLDVVKKGDWFSSLDIDGSKILGSSPRGSPLAVPIFEASNEKCSLFTPGSPPAKPEAAFLSSDLLLWPKKLSRGLKDLGGPWASGR